jgi:uncharacterized protein (DUF362 family)
MDRRDFLKVSAAAALSPLFLNGCEQQARWAKGAYIKPKRSQVAILAAESYGRTLRDTILRGIGMFRLDVRDKRILLKPNLVEFDPKGVINTHPAVIEAAVDSFKTLGAREVIVAEGPGHRRDNEYLLSASGLYDVLQEHNIRYVDLNTDNVRLTPLKSAFTRFNQLYLPETLYNADLLVSMPKLKTHHWAGVTLSLKNMFGVVPGSVYGWPKNALHWAGIDGSIIDINSSLPLPRFAIVDGVVGMEGNGPLQGQGKKSGVLLFGSDLVAVDATAARLMTIEPRKIKYLVTAAEFLGNLGDDQIEQIGENIKRHQQDFRVIEQFSHLKILVG